uniref:endoplasmic reticulum aminopeptidase 1b isoform X2 n=1 Tax=Doryrhamphus excisus TaxID=161450 RepID=UPI0025ADF26C|nr:endoplasmic reticulum aminopeptidase 1b isoform X2 [Doryrhamphus excisus]
MHVALLVLFVYLGSLLGAHLPYKNPGDITGAHPFPWDQMRLPKTVFPVHYEITIHPNLTTLDFTGVVRIQLDVRNDTNTIVLHAKQLKTFNVKLWTPESVTALRVLENPYYQQIALLSDEVLTKGKYYEVQLEFSAKLSDSYHGFYKSSYRTSSGEVRILASTQFQATFARTVFPCFDEPAFKANFTISIIREPRHIAISNMPKTKTVQLPGNMLEDLFGTTVKMSTYLVAFIVSDFESVSRNTQHGVKISVYTVPEKINQTGFALDVAAKLLDFFSSYFNIAYPLPKQDLAAIPGFQAGAMENWGLTTYGEAALLYDPDQSSVSDKLQIAKIIAHELAHQWFGNLVTMEWWNDLWLNEGFAKFMELISLDVTYPELQANNLFLGNCYNVMEIDSLSLSHPISTSVETLTEIQEMFDELSYDKGACILNMIKDFLTPEAFEVGIIRYLKRYSYRNTVSSNLWESLIDYTDKFNVKTIMDTWTLQQGFPLVSVTVRSRKVKLTQERYLKIADTTSSKELKWSIPLTYKTSASNITQHHLMKSKADMLRLPDEVEWLKFNVDMSGYYIVHYTNDGWRSIIKLLQNNHMALSGKDRASLIHDVFLLASIGKVGLETALDLSTYLSKETDIVAVSQGLGQLLLIYKLIEKRKIGHLEKSMKIYIVELFKGLINQQKWDDSGTVSQRMLRSNLLLFACVRNFTPCVTTASQLFNMWKASDGNMSLPVDVTMAVYAVGAQTSEGWDFLFEKYRRSVQMSVKSRIKTALTLTPLHHKLQWMLEQSLLGEVIKTEELPDVMISVSRNPQGDKLAWDFIQANWQTLIQKFGLDSSSIMQMVTGVTCHYSTMEMLESVQKFFDSLTKTTGSRMSCIQQAYDTITDNIRWTKRNLPTLQSWLSKRNRRVHEDL